MIKQKRGSVFAVYTLLFLLAASIAFFFFYRYEKTMIWENDGLYQHYNAFLYFGSWCRKILRSLFYDHKLVIPMWEWGIGYGADAITTLSYYTFGDPFALISVLTPYAWGEIGYAVSILLRFYAAGLAFCLYGREMGCRRWSTVCGGLMYVFCAFSLFAGVRHPYFMDPMIYFPLVLLGCERMLNGRSPAVFILSVFLMGISNFYFFYMVVLLTAVYVLIRLVADPAYRTLRVLAGHILRFVLCGLVGAAMAAVLLLPNIMSFLNNTRISDAYTCSALYSWGEYEALWGSFVGIDSAMTWSYVGVAPLAYLGMGALLQQKKKENRWMWMYLLAQLIFLLFPVFGYVLHGFGYVCNRWVFAWPLMVCYMFAKGFPALLCLDNREKARLSLGCAGYTLLCVLLEKSRTEINLVGCACLLGSLLFVWCAGHIRPICWGRLRLSQARLQQGATVCLALLCIAEGTYFRYAPTERNYIAEFHNKGTANQTLFHERAAAWRLINDDTFYRVDNSLSDNTQANFPICAGQSTTTEYWSLVNPDVAAFLRENSAYTNQPHVVKGLASRAWLLPLVSAKYFVATASGASLACVPYGYTLAGEAEGASGTYCLYRSEDALPFGYTYDKVISMESYEQMTIVQRQQATLQGAVLDDEEAALSGLTACQPDYADREIPYVLTCGENTEFDGKTLVIKENGARVTLTCTAVGEGELYVYLSGLGFESRFAGDLSSDGQETEKSAYETAAEKRERKNWTPATAAYITAQRGNASTYVAVYTDKSRYAEGRTEYVMNLGYREEEEETITLTFSQCGIYTLEDLSVICQPTENIKPYVHARREDTLEHVSMTDNHISGTIRLTEKKLLCLSLPYAPGWTAYVDGQETKLLQANVMFSGLVLEPGTHVITLTYRTPYLVPGAILTALGLAALVTICLLYKKRRPNVAPAERRPVAVGLGGNISPRV